MDKRHARTGEQTEGAAHGQENERKDGRSEAWAGMWGGKNDMITTWYYLHACGTRNEGSGDYMLKKVYYLRTGRGDEMWNAGGSVKVEVAMHMLLREVMICIVMCIGMY